MRDPLSPGSLLLGWDRHRLFPAIVARAEHSAPAPNATMHGAQIVRRSNFYVNAASTPLVRSKNQSSNVQVVVLIEAWQLSSPSELADCANER